MSEKHGMILVVIIAVFTFSAPFLLFGLVLPLFDKETGDNIVIGIACLCSIPILFRTIKEHIDNKNRKKEIEEQNKSKNKFNALCQEFHKNKREYDELEKIINSNFIFIYLYIIQNNCQQKYLEYKNIKNETFILFDKLKVLNSDQIYTNKDRFLEFEQMCNGINKLKNISIILKDFISKKQTTPEPTYTPPQSHEPPQPQLSRNEKLLKEYEEKQYLKAEEIGRRYERYIGYLYEIDGYKVDYNGIKKGVKDGGVDLICSKRKELIIIQCTCRDEQGQIHENTILQLIANLSKYKRKYPNKNVSAVLYTSHDNLDDEVKATLADEVAQGALIHHIIKAYNNSYPKVKCNISDNGEKIYHIPDHSATYDRIQIEINKGEFFAKTIKEAESAGFRASKA
ncbi:MAG: restriction endonuclease [Campylobacter sp.]|uniref:restriction endonuclease n=1 Tax=Campylobacter sp. TaxID=205 RepID=UPI002AA8F33E|nr:restriction endonuclease [Campylobacter sp.]MCI6694689.1 restriction endonuclease [Campylobacter sp.]